MLSPNVPLQLFHEFDEASRGNLSKFKDYCESLEWELDLSVITYLEGLPDKQMWLYLTAWSAEGQTKLFVQTPLEGAARKLGWKLYLHEKVGSAEKAPSSLSLRLETGGDPRCQV